MRICGNNNKVEKPQEGFKTRLGGQATAVPWRVAVGWAAAASLKPQPSAARRARIRRGCQLPRLSVAAAAQAVPHATYACPHSNMML